MAGVCKDTDYQPRPWLGAYNRHLFNFVAGRKRKVFQVDVLPRPYYPLQVSSLCVCLMFLPTVSVIVPSTPVSVYVEFQTLNCVSIRFLSLFRYPHKAR